MTNYNHANGMFCVSEEEVENVSGIPEFWLTVFKNVEMLNEMIQVHVGGI